MNLKMMQELKTQNNKLAFSWSLLFRFFNKKLSFLSSVEVSVRADLLRRGSAT